MRKLVGVAVDPHAIGRAKPLGFTEHCGMHFLLGMALALGATLGGAVRGLAAQGIDGTTRAAVVQTITAADLARHFSALATDSLRGRETPGPALERTARYLVHQFQQLGLQPAIGRRGPGAADSIWIQRYPIPGQHQLNYARSQVGLSISLLQAHGAPVVTETQEWLTRNAGADLATAAYFVTAAGPPRVVEVLPTNNFGGVMMGSEQVVLGSGRLTAATLTQAALAQKVVIYAPPAGLDSTYRQQVLAQLYTAAQGVILVGDADTARFTAALHAAQHHAVPVFENFVRDPLGEDRWPWAVAVRPTIVQPILAAAGLELPQILADTTPRLQDLPGLQAYLAPSPDTASPAVVQTAPNVVAWLDGTDPVLKQQVVVIAAPMDDFEEHIGPPDNLAAGAGHDAAGPAVLLALAKAFSQPGARPRRSVLFLATSGRGIDRWGSRFFIKPGNLASLDLQPYDLVAAVTLDLDGGLAGDSVIVDGSRNVGQLALPPAWAAAIHPELGITVMDSGSPVASRSDAFAFTRYAVPSLVFRTGELALGAHAGSAGQAPASRAAEAAARIARLVFYVGEAVAGADRRPRWKR